MSELAHYYKQSRAHQRSLWNGGGMLTIEPSGKTEHTYASAPYGFHAVSAYTAAKRSVNFRKTFLTMDFSS